MSIGDVPNTSQVIVLKFPQPAPGGNPVGEDIQTA